MSKETFSEPTPHNKMDYSGKSVPIFIFICKHLKRINNMLNIKPTLNPTSFQFFPNKSKQ